MAKDQVTCVCSAYPFPHRIGGGQCTGTEWSASYMEVDSANCQTCNCNTQDGSCDVANGAESFKECEGYMDYLHTQVGIKLPKPIEEFINEQYDEQCDD